MDAVFLRCDSCLCTFNCVESFHTVARHRGLFLHGLFAEIERVLSTLMSALCSEYAETVMLNLVRGVDGDKNKTRTTKTKQTNKQTNTDNPEKRMTQKMRPCL
jgi:hypothetical protein